MKLLNGFPSLAAVLVGALVLAACATGPAPVLPGGDGSTAPPIVSTQGSLRDEQALFAVEAAYNVAANAYVSADSRGVLPAAVKARAQPILVSAYRALEAARTAYRIGDATTFAAQASEATRLASQARALIPPG